MSLKIESLDDNDLDFNIEPLDNEVDLTTLDSEKNSLDSIDLDTLDSDKNESNSIDLNTLDLDKNESNSIDLNEKEQNKTYIGGSSKTTASNPSTGEEESRNSNNSNSSSKSIDPEGEELRGSDDSNSSSKSIDPEDDDYAQYIADDDFVQPYQESQENTGDGNNSESRTSSDSDSGSIDPEDIEDNEDGTGDASEDGSEDASEDGSEDGRADGSEADSDSGEEDYDIEYDTDEGDIIIIEEHEKSADKIILNEKQQKDDLFSELIRMIPEKDRENKYIVKDIIDKLNNYTELKHLYSILNPETQDIVKPKIKGDNYKTLLKFYMDDDYSKIGLIPIISEKKKIYVNTDDLQQLIQLQSTDDGNTIINTTIIEELVKLNKLDFKYRNVDGSGSKNYSYYNEMNEINSLIRPYENIKLDVGYKTKLISDTNVVGDCIINKKCVTYSDKYGTNNINVDIHKLLGPITRASDDKEILIDSDEITIIGYLMIPNVLLSNINLGNGINTLQEVINSNHNYLHTNLDEFDVNLEKIDLEYSITDKVKICILEGEDDELNQKVITGEIVEINENILTINPDEFPERDYDMITIDKQNKNIKVNKLFGLIKKEENNCYKNIKNKLGIYLFPSKNITIEDKQNILNNILPNIKTIINDNKSDLENIINFTQFEKIINKYHYTFNDITYSNLADIYNSINENCSNEVELIKQKISQYEKYLIDYSSRVIRNKISLINDKILKSFSHYYGEYPYYNLPIDNDNTRLKWITSQPDNGKLFFKTITYNIQRKTSQNLEKTMEFIRTDIQKMGDEIITLNIELEGKISKDASSETSCRQYNLVKKYTSLEELESDNFKPIQIGPEFIVHNFGTNIVKINDYAILETSNNKKLYKRIQTGDVQQWVLNSRSNLDNVISTYKDLCISRGKKLAEMDDEFFNVPDTEKCVTTDSNITDFGCVNKDIKTTYQKIENIKNTIEMKKEMLQKLELSPKNLEELEVKITQLKDFLVKSNILNNRKLQEIKFPKIEIDIDPTHELLYKQLESYLEKNSKLTPASKYTNLKKLVDKFGREPEEGENINSIYSKEGNKVLCCKCDTYFMKIYTEDVDHKETLTELNDTYGVELDGKNWCKICGKELSISGFESLEGFLKSGARDVTVEVLEDDATITGGEDSRDPVLEYMESYLQQIELKSSNMDLYTTIEILDNIISQLNIQLFDDDKLAIINDCNNIIQYKVPSKIEEWISKLAEKDQIKMKKGMKRKPEKVKEYFLDYSYRMKILYISSILILFLQSVIPSNKYGTKLTGYPLIISSTIDDSSIKMLSIILTRLSNSGGIWASLKKKKISELLLETINFTLEHHQHYKHKLDERRRSEKAELLVRQKFETYSIWNEFRPPLSEVSIEWVPEISGDEISNLTQDVIKSTIPQEEITLKTEAFKETMLMNSLQYIDRINTYINTTDIENIKYNKITLDNSCCLDTIDSNYRFNNFYDNLPEHGSELNTIKTSLLNHEDIKKQINNLSADDTIIIKSATEKRILQKFNTKLFYEEADLTAQNIKKLFEKFIDTPPYIGKSRIYDTNNRCILTGIERSEILSKSYSIDEYSSLLHVIKSNNLSYKKHRVNQLPEKLNIFKTISSNTIFQNNEIFLEFISQLSSDITIEAYNDLWDTMESHLELKIDQLSTSISNILSSKTYGMDIKDLITNLGNFKNIYDEDLETVSEDIALDKKYKLKESFIRRLFNSLIVELNKVINIDDLEYIRWLQTSRIPKTWKKHKLPSDSLETHFELSNSILKSTYQDTPLVYIPNKVDIFSKYLDIVSNIVKNITQIRGIQDIKDCRENIIFNSPLNYRQSSILFHYCFVLTLLELIEENKYDLEAPVEPDDEESFGEDMTTTKYSSTSVSISPEHKKIMSHFVYEFANNIKKQHIFMDKYNKKAIKKEIENYSESTKNQNLGFMAELSVEARQSFKAMVAAGLSSWKELSSKKEKLTSRLDHIAEDEDIPLLDVEQEQLDRNAAEDILGENFTDQQFAEFRESRRRERQNLIAEYEEREYLEDDDDANKLNFGD